MWSTTAPVGPRISGIAEMGGRAEPKTGVMAALTLEVSKILITANEEFYEKEGTWVVRKSLHQMLA